MRSPFEVIAFILTICIMIVFFIAAPAHVFVEYFKAFCHLMVIILHLMILQHLFNGTVRNEFKLLLFSFVYHSDCNSNYCQPACSYHHQGYNNFIVEVCDRLRPAMRTD